MTSESCTSIIEWLSDIEADTSAYWEQSSLQDASLPNATFSPIMPATSSPSSPSSPCFVGLKHSRKRKHHRDRLDLYSKDSYFDREPLKEMMSSPNKRARTVSEPLEDERAAQAEVRSINQNTALSSLLTMNSKPLLKHHGKKIQQAHNLSYEHPLPLSRSPRHQAVKGRRISQVYLQMPTR